MRAYAAADAVIKPAVFQTVRRFLFALPAEAGVPRSPRPPSPRLTRFASLAHRRPAVRGLAHAVAAVFGRVPPRCRHRSCAVPARCRRQAARPRVAAAARPCAQRLSRCALAWHVSRARSRLKQPPRILTRAARRISYCAATRFGSLWGNEYDASHTALARLIYVFYVSKIYEFMDTFIMLLKGNLQQARGLAEVPTLSFSILIPFPPPPPRQVSLLHVYHHASISCIWWVIAYVAPGGDAYFSAALNSLVHVLMYTYYLMAILIGRDAKARRSGARAATRLSCARRRRQAARDKYLFWGKYLTMFQMAQFVANLVQVRAEFVDRNVRLFTFCVNLCRLRIAGASRRTRASCRPSCLDT